MIDDLRYLIVFAKVAEEGSFSRAAEALGLSNATISMHLAKLEKNLGVALLYRNTRKLSLTHDGLSLLETARSMLELYEKGIIEFKQRAVSTTNQLKISIPAVFINSTAFMAEIAAFIRSHPGVQLDIQCSDHRSDIIGESIDVAFRIGDLPDSALKARHVFEFPRVVVGSPALLARFPTFDHPRDLAAVPWIGLTMRPNSRLFSHASGEQCEVKYQPQIRIDSVEAAYQLAKQGIGLAAPPDFLIADDLERGRIAPVLPAWSLSPMKVYAVWPGNVSPSSVAYTLINAIHHGLS